MALKISFSLSFTSDLTDTPFSFLKSCIPHRGRHKPLMDVENMDSNATDGGSPEAPSTNHQLSRAEQPPRTTSNMHAPPRLGLFSVPRLGQMRAEATSDKGKAKKKPGPFTNDI
jgi:hypothetical protein